MVVVTELDIFHRGEKAVCSTVRGDTAGQWCVDEPYVKFILYLGLPDNHLLGTVMHNRCVSATH